jgi:hypothetical protein
VVRERTIYRAKPPILELRDAGELAPGEPQLNEELYVTAVRFARSYERYQNPAGAIRSNFQIAERHLELGCRVQSGDSAFGDRVGETFSDASKAFRDAAAELGFPKGRRYLVMIQVVCQEMSWVQFGEQYVKGRGQASLFAKGELRTALAALRGHYRAKDSALREKKKGVDVYT